MVDVMQVAEWLGMFTAGGVISGVITARYTIKRAREEAKQAVITTDNDLIRQAQDAADKQIENANKLIEMYRQSLEDRTKLSQEHESQLLIRITDLESKLKELEDTNKLQGLTIDQDKLLIQSLSDTINELKVEIGEVKRLAEHDCNFCKFKAECDKYKTLAKMGKLNCQENAGK